MKPSDIKKVFPWDSVTQKGEAERIALNIIVILSRTGNTWRRLSWGEYSKERAIDNGKGPGWKEKRFFEQVVGYCVSEDTAKLFSQAWKEAAETAASRERIGHDGY